MSDLDHEAIYREICHNIRETDAISFKLLNLVPLGSMLAAGVLALFPKHTLPENTSQPALAIALIFLSLAGSSIVFGLYKWEQRNIQKCNWLIDRATDMEQERIRQYRGWRDQKTDWGKSRAEQHIYRTAILVWFLPIALNLMTLWLSYNRES